MSHAVEIVIDILNHMQPTEMKRPVAQQIVNEVSTEIRSSLLRDIEDVLADAPSRGKDFMDGWNEARDALIRRLEA